MSQMLRSLWNRWKPRRPLRRPTVRSGYRPQLEGLESRTTPSITLPSGTLDAAVLTGTSGHDQFVLRLLAGNNTVLQISDNGGTNFTNVSIYGVSAVNITGDAGQDTLTLDNSNGLVGDAGGLSVNFIGGTGHNTITLTGNPGSLVSETYLVGPTVDAGSLNVVAETSGSFALNFTGVAAITDTMNADTLKVSFPNVPNYITLNPGLAVGNLSTLKIAGIDYQNNTLAADDVFLPAPAPNPQLVASLGFVPITVANKATIIIAGGANTNLFLLNDPQAVTGLTDLVVDGGAFTNQIVGDGMPAGAQFNAVGIQTAIAAATSSVASDTVFVTQLYAQRLQRLPASSEVAYWIAVEHKYGQAAVVQGIEQSYEARSGLVSQWYTYYLNRPVDAGGLSYWVSLMGAGMTEEQALAGILGSPEYAALANNAFTSGTADQRLVVSLYQQLLNRNPASSDLTYWLNVKASRGAAQVAYMILTSAELRARFITAAVNAFFDSTPSSATIKSLLTSNFNFTLLREELLSTVAYLDPRKAMATPVAFSQALTAQEQGQSQGTTDAQFYSVVVGKAHTLAMSVQASSGTAPLVVLEDAVGNVIATTQPGSGVNKLFGTVFPGQTYYLRVVSSDGNPVSYTMGVTLL